VFQKSRIFEYPLLSALKISAQTTQTLPTTQNNSATTKKNKEKRKNFFKKAQLCDLKIAVIIQDKLAVTLEATCPLMKAAIKEKIDTLLTKKIANTSAKHSQCNRANLISLKKLNLKIRQQMNLKKKLIFFFFT